MDAPGLIFEGDALLPQGFARARIGIRGGRITSVDEIPPGAVAAASSAIQGPSVWMLPSGCLLIPGFVDGHTHLLSVGLAPLRPDLEGSATREDALARLDAFLDTHSGTEPVIGEGWDQSLWPSPEPMSRADLDRIAPDRPVALRRVCGHIAVLNSAALARLGTGWPDLDPESGLAKEALPLALHRLWPPSADQFDRAVLLAQREAWKMGVTAVEEMGHANGFRAFGRADAAGKLALRVTHFLRDDAIDLVLGVGLAPGFGSERLRFGGLKLFLDGSIGGRSAALRAPYADGGQGLLLVDDEKLHATLDRAFRAGLPVAMHAIGDAAIEQAIRTVERVREAGILPPAPGPRLEHLEMIDAALLERAVRAGFLLSMQPNFTARWQHPGELYETALGRERALALNPYRAVAATGRLLFGSDTMPLDPLLGVRGAVAHPLAGERLDPEAALRAYTAAPAGAVSHGFGNGSLVSGARADLVLLRAGEPGTGMDPARLRAAFARPGGVSVAATWFDGILRYAAPGPGVPEGTVASGDPGGPDPERSIAG